MRRTLHNIIITFSAVVSAVTFPLSIFTFDSFPVRTAVMIGIATTWLTLLAYANAER